MTVSSNIPIEEYTGNGVITQFDWDWAMINDSAIEVLVDNEYVDGWNLQGQSVIFDVPPADGALVQIFRRTKLWMPEDYVAFGRFHADKTELSVDRAIMIAQERAGDRGKGNAANGIVGGADLHTRHNEFDVDLISERGDDTVVPHWLPDDTAPPIPPTPDPSILWAGADIVAGRFSLEGNTSGMEAIGAFWLDSANFIYDNFNSSSSVPWVDHVPADGEYWCRITELNPVQPKRVISDGSHARASGEVFQLTGNPNRAAYMTVYTFGDPAPVTKTSYFQVEICKDLNGLPDGAWASRNVSIEAIFNLEGEYTPPTPTVPPPAGVDTTGAVAWFDWFGEDFDSISSDNTTKVIPPEGISIWFTVPAGEIRPIKVNFTCFESWDVASIRTGALNTTVGDFVTPPTFSWGNGTGFRGGINMPGVYDIDLIPGNTYIWNMRNNTVHDPNWISLAANFLDQT